MSAITTTCEITIDSGLWSCLCIIVVLSHHQSRLGQRCVHHTYHGVYTVARCHISSGREDPWTPSSYRRTGKQRIPEEQLPVSSISSFAGDCLFLPRA